MKEQLREYGPMIMVTVVVIAVGAFVFLQMWDAATKMENVENGRIRVDSIKQKQNGYQIIVGEEVVSTAFVENIPKYVEEDGWYRADYEVINGDIIRITDWHGTAHGRRYGPLLWVMGICSVGLVIGGALRYFSDGDGS